MVKKISDQNLEKMLESKKEILLKDWMERQYKAIERKKDLINDQALNAESLELLNLLLAAISKGNFEDITTEEYNPIIYRLKKLSKNWAKLGFSPSETATYIFSLKDSFIEILQEIYRDNEELLRDLVIKINKLLDKLGLVTFEEYVKGRQEVINTQQDSIIELSSPIITIWERVLAIPIIGILDSKRSQVIMQNLLNKIIDTESKMAIIDITGVALVDSAVANHLIKTVKAVRIIGAEAIITGIRPEIAQTMIELGISMSDIITLNSLKEGLLYCLTYLGFKAVKE